MSQQTPKTKNGKKNKGGEGLSSSFIQKIAKELQALSTNNRNSQ